MTQLGLDFAAAQRDKGILRSSVRAENLAPGWASEAYRHLASYACAHAQFNSLDFREHLAAIGFAVPVPKALGGIFQKAARARLIRKIGFDQHPERHCSPTPRWASSAYRMVA